MHQQEKIAGMDMHVGHSIAAKSMLVKGIMSAVQPEALICDVKTVSFFRSVSSLLILTETKRCVD